jgi:hypothetical protein
VDIKNVIISTTIIRRFNKAINAFSEIYTAKEDALTTTFLDLPKDFIPLCIKDDGTDIIDRVSLALYKARRKTMPKIKNITFKMNRITTPITHLPPKNIGYGGIEPP